MNQEPIEAIPIHEVPEGERACPVCGALMAVQSIKGASIDVCHDHGLWLDKGELPKILSVVRGQSRRRTREAVRRARKDGKMSGALFGWWSLLGD